MPPQAIDLDSLERLTRIAVSIATVVGLGLPVLLAAFAWWITKIVPTKEQLQVVKKEIQRDINGQGERVERLEKLHMGVNDTVATIYEKQQSLEHRTGVLEQYGGPAVTEIQRTLRKLDRTVSRIADKMDVPHE